MTNFDESIELYRQCRDIIESTRDLIAFDDELAWLREDLAEAALDLKVALVDLDRRRMDIYADECRKVMVVAKSLIQKFLDERGRGVMARRRNRFVEMSQEVIEYFVSRVSMTQTEIADLLEVDKSFISRVRNGERELSSFHLERLAEKLGVDVGVMLIDATRPKKPVTPEIQKIMDLCEKAILQADKATKQLKIEIGAKRAS